MVTQLQLEDLSVAGHPEELTIKINECFAQKGIPNNLTLVYAAGQGDQRKKD